METADDLAPAALSTVERGADAARRGALGVKSPRGPKPKRPNEQQNCEWCGRTFIAKGSELARGGGRFCSPQCGVEASNPCRDILTVRERRETVALLYLSGMTMQHVADRLGTNRQAVFKDLKRQGITGRRHGISHEELGASNIARIRQDALAELASYCEQHGLVTATQANGIVPGNSGATLTSRAVGLKPTEIRRFGLWQWTLYRRHDVQAFLDDRPACQLDGCEKPATTPGGYCSKRHAGAAARATPEHRAAISGHAQRWWREGVGAARATVERSGGRVRQRYLGRWAGQQSGQLGGRPRALVSDEQTREIEKLAAQGWGSRAIANRVLVSRHAVRQALAALASRTP